MRLELYPKCPFKEVKDPASDGVIFGRLKPYRHVVRENSLFKRWRNRHFQKIAARNLSRHREEFLRVFDELLTTGKRVEHFECLRDANKLKKLVLRLSFLL